MRHAAAEARARRRMKTLTMLLLFTCVRTSLPALLDESTLSLHTETNVTETNASDGRILFVNICRNSCGFCQALLPAWAQFARRMGTSARVGLWDADMPQPVPSLFGAVEATPTILALVPARNLGKGASSEGSHGDMGAEAAPGSQGTVQIVLYKGPRHTDALVDFAMMLLPDRVALLDSAERFRALTRVALNRSRPRVISFLNISSTAPTPPFLRALAADFRRRALLSYCQRQPSAPRRRLQKTVISFGGIRKSWHRFHSQSRRLTSVSRHSCGIIWGIRRSHEATRTRCRETPQRPPRSLTNGQIAPDRICRSGACF